MELLAIWRENKLVVNIDRRRLGTGQRSKQMRVERCWLLLFLGIFQVLPLYRSNRLVCIIDIVNF